MQKPKTKKVCKKMDAELTPEEKYQADTGKFKLPQGDSFIELLSDGERQEINYAKEGDAPKVELKLVYRVNVYSPSGSRLAQEVELPMPRAVLNTLSEIRKQAGGAKSTIVGRWVKVRREGEGMATKYYPFPLLERPKF